MDILNAIAIRPRTYPLGQNQWDLDSFLPVDYVIPPEYFEQAPETVLENFRALLSRDVYSEGDAQLLYEYITDRKSEMSDAFLGMLELWLSDETKHYEGLRRVYHCLTGISFTQMNGHFESRERKTEPIQLVLEDEFTMLVAFMFDEISSVYSYRRDLKEYYCHFGRSIHRMGKHLVQDEGMHFNNAAQVLLACHRHRLSEVEGLLYEISKLEKSLKRYYNTFFLDHAQEQFRFPTYFNRVIIQVILAKLGLGDRPSASELRSLWQWIPEGYDLVPIHAA